MTMNRLKSFLMLLCGVCAFGLLGLKEEACAQSSYIDLTIVESVDYNKPLGSFSREAFDDAFHIASLDGDQYEADLDRALVMFIDLLLPERSYIIQHEPTYYFVLQYNRTKNNYLVMNNSIGAKDDAIYVDTFKEAQYEMLKLLQVFYSSTPVLSVEEYRY